MKRKLALRVVAAAASTTLFAASLTAGAIVSAQAATKSTVTLLSAGDITSLNSSTNDGNTAYNAQVSSLTGMGFWYYNSDAKLIMNTKFGTMKVVKSAPKDFQIQYTVRSGQQWSDGTPINAVDLLLTHVVSSDKYSKDAGLGDPSGDVKPAFDSGGYGGTYGTHVVGVPTLSSNKMSLTVKFDKPLPDWELLAPGPSPVHALSLMADGKKGLQSAAVNAAAKAKFLRDFTSKNSTALKAMGKVWTSDYDVTKVDATTNPLLLISNGGFIVSKFTFGDSLILVRNAKYSSGPAMATKNPIKTVVIKVIRDNTAAVQALRNGDIDVYYQSNPVASDKVALSALPNVTVSSRSGGTYSHLDLRVDSAQGESDTYSGPFAGNGLRAKDLRKAFLLATPRDQMVDTLVKPVNSTAKPLNTTFTFEGTPEYNTITNGSGVSQFTTGTQAERTAQALALVKKYYPAASESNPLVKIKFVHADTSLRNSLAKLIQAETKKAGFDVELEARADLFGTRGQFSAKYDVTMYAFVLTSVSQANGNDTYRTDGSNNVFGWSDSALDNILKSLQGDILTSKQVTEKRLAADKIIFGNYWFLPLYANATLSAYNKDLKNVKPAPFGNILTWNYFEWSY
jgi:peptide/nickel transport system substrate-binding protein